MKNIFTCRNIFLWLLFLVVLGGCSSHTKYLESNFTMPDNYEFSSNLSDNNISTTWWTNFNSPTLNYLIERGKTNSFDVLIAMEKLEQSRLLLENAGILYYPTLDASFGTGGSRVKPDGDSWGTTKSTSASIGIKYEIDLWGKIAGQKESAKAYFLATKYDKDATLLTLYSSIAQTYFNLIATNERLKIAQDNLKISTQLMDIVKAKYNAGSVSALDVNQQQTVLLTQKLNVETLKNQANQYKNALSILIGDIPQNWSFESDDLWNLTIPEVKAGLPSELLLSRPDIAVTKENVAVANANTKVANAERFPSFSLSASGGISSSSLVSFKDPTSTLSIGLNAVYTLFDWGKLKNLRDIEVSKTRSAIATYHKTILMALQETEDALNGVAYQKSQAILKKEIVDYVKNSFDIASLQYKHGSRDFVSLLDTQKSYFDAVDSLANQRLNHLNAVIMLYKALGGGWSDKSEI